MTRLQELSARIDAKEVRVGVIGLGYVGLPLAIEFGKAGLKVTGFDLDEQKVRSIEKDTSYIEDVPSEDIAAARAAGCQTANGLGMLLHQGAKALEIWSGQAAPLKVMRAALEEAVNG